VRSSGNSIPSSDGSSGSSGRLNPGVSATAVIQLGSIAAVIGYFRGDLRSVLHGISGAMRRGQWREPDARLGIAMVVGTVPILTAGLVIKLS